MTELEFKLLEGVQNLQSDMTDVKVTMAKNTEALEYHIKRTDDLQKCVEALDTIVKPVYAEFISKKAVQEYKKQQREELVYKLKLPGYIVAALAAVSTIIAWFMSK